VQTAEEQDEAQAANAAIAYHPDSHVADRPKIMGRHSAGAGFLDGFLAHAQVDAFRFHVASAAHREHLKARLAAYGPLRRPVEAISPHGSDRLAAVGALQLADPTLPGAAWTRRVAGDRAYSLCGLTHTISSVQALEAIGQCLVAPVQPWDALICTSRCVHDEVKATLEQHADYLAGRMGRVPTIPLQLPVIPLGVDATRYAEAPDRRAALRARIGAGRQDVIILFLGRLSFHAKANPLPLVLAASRAARLTSRRLHVLFVGQFHNPGQEAGFRSVSDFASDLDVHFLPGDEPDVVEDAWRGADIFASLSDNIQESFGLSVIEAMAAGLPVVASDWNGYRDTVQDGVTGFLIPTVFAPPGVGPALAARHRAGLDDYDHFIGAVALATAVDVEAAAKALARLADDESLRLRMGAAGRTAARDTYDWRHVVRAHQSLWAELARLRRAAPGLGVRSPGGPAHPLHRDPFVQFASHPTRSIAAADLVHLDDLTKLEPLFGSRLAVHGLDYLRLPPTEIRTLVAKLQPGPMRVEALVEGVEGASRRKRLATLAWLMKFGVVFVEAAPVAAEERVA
jgi:glycosyltransferase involved in cell wall biosynthesis